MNCYLSRNYKGTANAGNKAKTDIEKILSEAGFRNAGLRQTVYRQPVMAFLMTLGSVLKMPFGLHRDDCLVIQYPLKKYFAWACRLAHWRGAKVVTVIHDLGSFRRKKLTAAQEVRRLDHADYIVAHNESMRAFLEENGCLKPVGELGIFDYLSSAPFPVSRKAAPPYRVLYAGGLNYRKNRFLYMMGHCVHSYEFYLYGRGFEPDRAVRNSRMHYKGFRLSDELIACPDADFGLVWDGASVESCTGNYGEYLRYNNPHKTSLYLRAGLPVIVWSQSALAPFVRRHGIGFCVDSLAQADALLASLPADEYARMSRNACAVGGQIGLGRYVLQAVERAVDYLKNHP